MPHFLLLFFCFSPSHLIGGGFFSWHIARPEAPSESNAYSLKRRSSEPPGDAALCRSIATAADVIGDANNTGGAAISSPAPLNPAVCPTASPHLRR